MSLGLPYKSEINSFDGKSKADNILCQLVEKCTSNEDYKAICMIESGAWGTVWQKELVQLKDGGFIVQSWTDPSKNPLSEMKKVQLDLDLGKEIMALKSAQFVFRSSLNKNPDVKTREEFARVGYLYLAVGSEANWLAFPRQITGGVYENNALNRICYAFANVFSEKTEVFFSLLDEEDAKPIIDAIDSWPMYFQRLRYELEEQVRRDGPIKAYVSEALAQDARDKGFELQPYQPVEIMVSYAKQDNRNLIDFRVEFSEDAEPIWVSPNYLLIDESEPLYEAIKEYQESLQDTKWISVPRRQ
jgi:hypothetical protein